MSNVIGFLESAGCNAALRHATRAQLLEAMRREELPQSQCDALLRINPAAVDSPFGVRETLYCALFPVKTPPPKKAPPKKAPAKVPPKKAPAKKPAKKAPAKKSPAKRR